MKICALLAGLATSFWFAFAARGDDAGLTVSGSGEARGRPTAVEFYTRLGGSGELSSDALLKFREFKRRTLAALEKQRFSRGDVEIAGFSFTADNGAGQNFMAFRLLDAEAPAAKASATFSSLVRVKLRGIDRMSDDEVLETVADITDRLSDSGVTIEPVQTNTNASEFGVQDGFGSPPLAIFVVEDATELHEKARARAFAAARHSAEQLARLAGARLGPVAAIRETSGEQELWIDAMGDGMPRIGERGKLRLTSSTLSPLPVRVDLEVRFTLLPAGDDTLKQERAAR